MQKATQSNSSKNDNTQVMPNINPQSLDQKKKFPKNKFEKSDFVSKNK